MIKKIILFIFTFQIGISLSQEKAAIWNGFDHTWSYNHRVNRLGSFITKDSIGQLIGKHLSASGTGADSTYFNQYYTIIQDPNLQFYYGSEKIKLEGKEMKMLTKTSNITLNLPQNFKKQQFQAIMSGFQITSTERSDKPVHFLINLGEVDYDSAKNSIRFDIQADWVGNCETAECSVFKNTTSYEFIVHYLLIGSQNTELIYSQHNLSKSYSWNKKKQYHSSPLIKKHRLNEGYQSAFIGLKSISFTLDKEQWLQELTYHIQIEKKNLQTKEIEVVSNMKFLDWKEKMKRNAVKKRSAMLASKNAGWANLELNYYLFQSKNSTISIEKKSGSLFWKGKNQIATDLSSESSFILK